MKNMWTIDRIVASLEEDEKAELQRYKEKDSNSNPEFSSPGTLQNLKPAAQFRR
jgi:hypothetical protein